MSEPSLYPRTYRYGWKSKLLISLFLILVVAIAGGLAYNYRSEVDASKVAIFALGAIFISFALLHELLEFFLTRLTIFEDRFVYKSVFSTRTVFLSDIKQTFGFERNFNVVSFNLYLHSSGTKTVSIKNISGLDDFFWEYISKFDNAERAHAIEIHEALLSNPIFGGDRTEREAKIKQQNKLIRLLMLIGVAISAWGFFYPQPYDYCLLTLAIFPVVVTVIVFFQ